MKGKREQKRFVNELIKNVKQGILVNLPNIPKEWDGIELRMFIADHFNRAVFKTTRNRKRNYNNELWTKNLI